MHCPIQVDRLQNEPKVDQIPLGMFTYGTISMQPLMIINSLYIKSCQKCFLFPGKNCWFKIVWSYRTSNEGHCQKMLFECCCLSFHSIVINVLKYKRSICLNVVVKLLVQNKMTTPKLAITMLKKMRVAFSKMLPFPEFFWT